MDVDQAFQATCKVIFGREVGHLSDFAPYLQELMYPCQKRKSLISGKEVTASLLFYPPEAKFISQDELGKLKFPPLNPNEIKDIDSLFAAVSERAVYCGNKVFGRNYEVEDVDNCVDCAYVSHSHNVRGVKYGAYLSYQRDSEFMFGSVGFPKSYSSIRCFWGVGANRCFESYYSTSLSQTYYAFNCIGCSDCMFAFNLRSRRHTIGNLQLEKGRYLQLKEKLVSEMADELEHKKKLPSIIDLAFIGRGKVPLPSEKPGFDSPVPKKVEEGFRSTTRLLLGEEHRNIQDFGPWLSERITKVKRVKGAFGTPAYLPVMPVIGRIPPDRLATLEEGMRETSKPIGLAPGESPSFHQMLQKAAKVAYFCIEFVDGQNDNCVDTPSIFSGSNVYKLLDTTNAKYSAYSTGVVDSEYIFGGFLRILDSQFCINCFDSTKLKGCFEVDGSYSSRNLYFCHNVENCSDCMFCFNAKSLQYAVGNTVVGKEEYARIRKMLLDYLNRELGEKHSVGITIFAMPKGRRKG